jgi:hypothetical protein
MEDILAITFIFGGGTLILLAFSPVGKAFADRIRFGRQSLPAPEVDGALYDEVDRLRGELNEMHERLDFAERLLAKGTTGNNEEASNVG